MIDRRAHEGQPDRDVHARLDAEHLDRAVPLVVIHRHHQVEVAASGAVEQRVGRQRSLDVEASCARRLDAGKHLGAFLATAETDRPRRRAG